MHCGVMVVAIVTAAAPEKRTATSWQGLLNFLYLSEVLLLVLLAWFVFAGPGRASQHLVFAIESLRQRRAAAGSSVILAAVSYNLTCLEGADQGAPFGALHPQHRNGALAARSFRRWVISRGQPDAAKVDLEPTRHPVTSRWRFEPTLLLLWAGLLGLAAFFLLRVDEA